MSLRIHIEEILIEGPALSRREREQLRALLVTQLGPAPSQVDCQPSRLVADLGRVIVNGIRSALPAGPAEADHVPASDTPMPYNYGRFAPYSMAPSIGSEVS
jgi:hypothetical protein